MSRRTYSDAEIRVKAIEKILTEKGLIYPATIEAIIQTYETRIGPHIGAGIVARAWTDPSFKARLLDDASAVVAELGLAGLEGTHVEVKENTETVHNLVVCTLCSCYPWALLGLPPAWYKSSAYRSRAVIEPRAILNEFGVAIEPEVEIRVWDSNADIRYLVLPMRPPGTETLDVEALAALISRDAMVGTARVAAP
jgi:nitrile hydratase